MSAHRLEVLEEEALSLQKKVIDVFGKNIPTLDGLRQENKELRDKVTALEQQLSKATANTEGVDALKRKLRTALDNFIQHELTVATPANSNGQRFTRK